MLHKKLHETQTHLPRDSATRPIFRTGIPKRRDVAVRIILLVVAGLLWTSPTVVAQRLPSVDEVVNHIDDLWRSTSSHAVMTMTVVRARGTRTLTLESWSRGEDEALIVIRAPAREAGTATLRTPDGLWNYAPRADRLIRVPSGLLSESWMGSDFTNDDLLRESSYLDDHTTTLAWRTVDGERFLELTLIPKPDLPVVYTRLTFLLEPVTYTPRRSDYYDGDELTRSMVLDQVRIIAGQPVPMRMLLLPADRPEERTEMLYEELELNVAVSSDLFTRRGLRRVAVQ